MTGKPMVDVLLELMRTTRPLPRDVLHVAPLTGLPFPTPPGPTAPTPFGLPVRTDPRLAPGTAELRGEDGTVLARMEGLPTLPLEVPRLAVPGPEQGEDSLVTRYLWRVGLALTPEELKARKHSLPLERDP